MRLYELIQFNYILIEINNQNHLNYIIKTKIIYTYLL